MYKQQNMCCPDTTKLQHDYYCNQAGGSLPHFTGGEYQRGHGLGTIMSGVMRASLPLLPPNIVSILKRKALAAGIGVVGDVLKGKRLKTAVKDRALASIGIKKAAPKKTAPKKKKPIKRPASRKRVSSVPARKEATSRYSNTVFN